MLKLYGAARSRAVRNIWMLNELGVDYEHLDWLPRSSETKTPEFRTVQSSGAIPVLDDDGFILSESMAINFYLAQKYNSSLYPSDPKEAALALQWSLWETDKLDRQVVNHSRHSNDLPEAERKPEIAEAAWAECQQGFEILNNGLGDKAFLVGSSFSIADLNVASALYRALVLDLAPWPNLQAWLNGCWERPAAQKARALRE